MSTRDLIGGFYWEHVAHTLHILDKSGMTIRTHHRFDLVAARRERFFERRVAWTGSGLEKEPRVLSGRDELGHSMHNLHGPVIREGVDRIMLVDLGRWLEPGDREAVEIEHTFVDAERTLKSHLGGHARQGTLTVALTVILPKEYDGVVKAEEYAADTAVPRSREFVDANETEIDGVWYKIFHVKIDDASPGCNYRLVWQKIE